MGPLNFKCLLQQLQLDSNWMPSVTRLLKEYRTFLCDIRMQKDNIDCDDVDEQELKKIVAGLGYTPNKYRELHKKYLEHYKTILDLFDTAIADTPRIAPPRVSQKTNDRNPAFRSIIAEVFGLSTMADADQEVPKSAGANPRKCSSQTVLEDSPSNRKKASQADDRSADDIVADKPAKRLRTALAV